MPVIKSKIMQKRSLHPHSRKKSSQKQQSHKPQVNQEHDFLPSKKSSSGQYKETKTRDTSYVFATPTIPLQYIYKKRQKTITPHTHSEISKHISPLHQPRQMTTRSMSATSSIPYLQITYSSQQHTTEIDTQNDAIDI